MELFSIRIQRTFQLVSTKLDMDHIMPSISETNRLQDSQPRPFSY